MAGFCEWLVLDGCWFWTAQSTSIAVVDSAESTGLDVFAKLMVSHLTRQSLCSCTLCHVVAVCFDASGVQHNTGMGFT